MRGQYQILEQVVLFGIGLIILTAVFSIFSLLGNRVGVSAVHDNFKEIGLLVVSNVLEIHEQGKYFHNATIKLDLPRAVGGSVYRLRLDRNGVKVNATDTDINKAVVGLYNLNNTVLKMFGVELSTQSPLELAYFNFSKEAVLRR